MMDFQDYYHILGVQRSADDLTIKKAYRKLAMKYHPDKNKNNKDAHHQFIKIQEAYEVLKDPVQKQKYDQLFDIRQKVKNTGSYTKSNTGQHTAYTSDETYWKTDVEEEDSGIFSSFFKHFFSKKRTKYDYSYLYKGKDVKGKIEIDLEEAFLGSERILTLNGEKLRIKIKPGVKNNQVIKIKEKGAYSEIGVQRGDLIITILIRPNQIFKRKENDLYRDLHVNIYTAILGGKIQFETLHGTVKIGIPEGTKQGTKLRVKGKGMPKYTNPDEYGDLYVIIQHKMPTILSDEEKNLLNRLKEINSRK